ncbi:hypothetical protein BGX26_006587, partial [Mortierella sp. AD094]
LRVAPEIRKVLPEELMFRALGTYLGMGSFVRITCLDINDKMRKSTQTPNEVPENAVNAELLEYPEGSERNVYQENPLPCPATGGIHQNTIDALVTIQAAVDISHGVSTSIFVANDAKMRTGHFEGLSDSLVPGEKSQCLLDIPMSPCNDDLVNIESTEV